MRRAWFAIAGAGICGLTMAQTVATRDNNVYLTDSSGQRLQLTSQGADLYPVLSPDRRRVAFVRLTVSAGDEGQQICVVDVGLGEPPPICSSVRYQSGEDPLGGFSRPLWSGNGNEVYFLADFSSQTKALCRFDPSTGSASFVSPVDRATGEWRSIAERIGKL